jgi:hypothetical protein
LTTGAASAVDDVTGYTACAFNDDSKVFFIHQNVPFVIRDECSHRYSQFFAA